MGHFPSVLSPSLVNFSSGSRKFALPATNTKTLPDILRRLYADLIFGRPFVKRFAQCYQSVVCLSVCLSVLSETLVYCGQTVRWIKVKVRVQVGLVPVHIVLDVDPASPPPKGQILQFPAYICCGQMAGWIKMPLGMEVGLGPGDFC